MNLLNSDHKYTVYITPVAKKISEESSRGRFDIAKIMTHYEMGHLFGNFDVRCEELAYWVGNDMDIRIYAKSEKNAYTRKYDILRRVKVVR